MGICSLPYESAFGPVAYLWERLIDEARGQPLHSLADALILSGPATRYPQDQGGRRLRVFARLVSHSHDTQTTFSVRLCGNMLPSSLLKFTRGITYRSLLCALETSPKLLMQRAFFDGLPLRDAGGGSLSSPANAVERLEDMRVSSTVDPSLHTALQDLAFDFAHDTHDACAAFDDPDCWYPGVDEGIEPVPDVHVELVIAALQRELNRERRDAKGNFVVYPLPAVVLRDLPFRIQRALVERRRLRFAQFGIGQEQWRSNRWSLWDVPDDPTWVPRDS